jgi:putative oxidoreductase
MMVVATPRWKGGGFPRDLGGEGRDGAPPDRGWAMRLETATTTHAAFLRRVSLGAILLAHGFVLKIMTFGLAGTMGFFGSIGYPPVLGAVVAIAETLAGIALIAGVWVRAASLLMIPIMIGATIQHVPAGWMFSARGGGWEFPAFWTVALLVQAGLGAGAFALTPERLLGRRVATA